MSQRVITSRDNKIFKELHRLLDARGLKKQERTIVAGEKLVRELMRERPQDCRRLIVPESFQGMNDAAGRFAAAGRRIVLNRGLFGELDMFGTKSPLLELSAPAIAPWDGRLTAQGCTLLLPFQDPANVGVAARSAAAFGVRQVVLLREAAHPFHPKSIRASAGAVFRLSFLRGPSLAEVAGLAGTAGRVIALDMGGVPIDRFAFPPQFLLLPGTEGQGLPAELRHRSVSIPMTGGVESLNAATAVAIALYCLAAGKAS